MIYEKTYVKKLIRKELTGKLSKKGAARLLAAWALYTDEDMAAMEWEVMRELAASRPSVSRHDARALVRAARAGWVRKRWKTLGRAAAVAAVFIAAVGVSYFSVTSILRSLHDDAGRWSRRVDAVPRTVLASVLHWGDTDRLSVPGDSRGYQGRIGGLEVWRDENGELELLPAQFQSDQAGPYRPDIQITTGPRQQEVVNLPGGYRVRLDANSSLLYPLANLRQVEPRVGLTGQALVQVSRNPGHAPADFTLETAQGSVTTRAGTYTVLATASITRLVLLEGAVEGDFPAENGRRFLSSQGDLVQYDRCCVGPEGEYQPTLTKVLTADLGKALRWAGQTREYDDVPLRDFVTAELRHWHGVEARSLACIPEDTRITASVSYDDPVETIYARLHAIGVPFQEHNGMISFCGPEVDPLRQERLRPPDTLRGPRELLDRLYDPRGLLADYEPGRKEAAASRPALY